MTMFARAACASGLLNAVGGDDIRRNREDEILVARCQAGEHDAFQLLLERYRDRVVNLAYSFLHSHEDAEDAAQDAFTIAFDTIGAFRGDARFWTWLYRITVNQCLQRRRRGRALESLDEQEYIFSDIQSIAVSRIEVRRALDELS